MPIPCPSHAHPIKMCSPEVSKKMGRRITMALQEDYYNTKANISTKANKSSVESTHHALQAKMKLQDPPI
jgi:hypothetical protein